MKIHSKKIGRVTVRRIFRTLPVLAVTHFRRAAAENPLFRLAHDSFFSGRVRIKNI